MKYDKELQTKTRLFSFDDDNLDNSQMFLEACNGNGPSVSRLPGTHLTPVYLKFDLSDLDLPDEARDLAAEVSGGFKEASFGSKDNLDLLVQEICDWVLGKEPSFTSRQNDQDTSQFMLSGESTDPQSS